MPSRRLAEHVRRGVLFNACSLYQLESYGKIAPGGSVCAAQPGPGQRRYEPHQHGRPGLELRDLARAHPGGEADRRRIRVEDRSIHSHIGSGSDPEVYKRVAWMTLDLVEQFPDATIVNLGGGFKVGRMPGEVTADLQDIGHHVERELIEFQERLGRRLHLEAEPGTYLVANAGAGDLHRRGGHRQGRLPVRKLDNGMTEVTRPALYGAQHPITVLGEGATEVSVVFVGPCCESGDILTPASATPRPWPPERRGCRPSAIWW